MKLEKVYGSDNSLLLLSVVNKAFPDGYVSSADLGKKFSASSCALKILDSHSEIVGLLLLKITTVVEVTLLCVVPEAQRKGYGSYALTHIKQMAVASGMPVVVRVNERNLQAQQLLKSCAFVCNVYLTTKNTKGDDIYHFEYEKSLDTPKRRKKSRKK